MEILKIVLIALIAAVLAMLVKQHRPELAMQIGIGAGLLILLMALDGLTQVVETITQVAQKYGINTDYLGVVLKIIGVAYVAQFASQVCKDAGESAIAGKVELAGKIMMLLLTLPAVLALLEMITSLIPAGLAS